MELGKLKTKKMEALMLLGWEHVEYCRVLARAAKHFVRPGQKLSTVINHLFQTFIFVTLSIARCRAPLHVKSPTHRNRQSVPHLPERDI